MRRSASLPVLQKKILDQLAQVQFATNTQLVKLCDSHASHVSTTVNELLNVGLIDGSLLTRPMILHLTPAGDCLRV